MRGDDAGFPSIVVMPTYPLYGAAGSTYATDGAAMGEVEPSACRTPMGFCVQPIVVKAAAHSNCHGTEGELEVAH